MPTFRYNRPAPLTVFYVRGDSNEVDRLELNPGITLNACSDEEWQWVKQHPIVQVMLKTGELEPLKKAPGITQTYDPEGIETGFEVVEDAASGQPMPVAEPIKSGRRK